MKTKGTPVVYTHVSEMSRLTTDKTATIAEVSLHFNGTSYFASGSSWRMAGDKYDESKGNLLAVQRAVRQLANMIDQEVSNLAE